MWERIVDIFSQIFEKIKPDLIESAKSFFKGLLCKYCNKYCSDYCGDSAIALKPSSLPDLPKELQSRVTQILTLVYRIESGQSSAIIGFKNELTSILDYLSNSDYQREIYSTKMPVSLIFSQVNISELEEEISVGRFWENALKPLLIEIPKKRKYYGYFLETVNNQLRQRRQRLVLVLNKFEKLLFKPKLATDEFLTSLRTVANNYDSPFTLILAGSISLSYFDSSYQKIHPSPAGSSPPLNFVQPTILGALSQDELNSLLEQRGYRWSKEKCEFLQKITGGHPCFLEGPDGVILTLEGNPQTPYHEIGNIIYPRMIPTMRAIVQSWPQSTHRAIAAVAQQQQDTIPFEEELKLLLELGFVTRESGNWAIRSSIFSQFVFENLKYE